MKAGKLVHVAALHIKRRMHIPVQGYGYIGMPQYFAKAFYFKAKLHTAGGEGMPSRMELASLMPQYVIYALKWF